MSAELATKLRRLSLSGMAEHLALRLEEAQARELAPAQFLELLVEDELVRRRDRLLARRVKQARFAELKRLEDFDFRFNPSIDRRRIFELATARFVAEHRGLLFLGPSGTGKSHLAQALGLRVVQAGHPVRYASIYDLLEEMAEAEATGTRRNLVASLTKVDLLILDDVAMKRMTGAMAEDFLELVHRRHGRAATMLASNRPLEDWGKQIGDAAATMAILDRFLEDAEVIAIKGRSYRLRRYRGGEALAGGGGENPRRVEAPGSTISEGGATSLPPAASLEATATLPAAGAPTSRRSTRGEASR